MKIAGTRTPEEMVADQVHKWRAVTEERKKEAAPTVITVSREAGSGGREIAERVAKELGYDFFSQEILTMIAESAQMRESVIETMDESARSVVREIFMSLTDKQHLWPYEYLNHLVRVLGGIASHGRAVLLGRGAQFVLSPIETLRVRMIAPIDIRTRLLAHELKITREEAQRRVLRNDADRLAFARKYFNTSIEDPRHYDLVINSYYMGIQGSVDTIKTALKVKKMDVGWQK
jgi:cytidylate kinase